ncbi:MAG: SUMF1/EgtB/PvdO family nonheme iron enzyme, partial [Planctomycetota bacterium]|nr:SUMF1/EgtB/PvdO family nonheme iron enzyme [Planctomycetota bacterium]
DESKQGYFTRFFLQGIQKGNADKSRWGNRDGLLSGEELYLYIFEHLPEQVRRDKRREQQPQRKPPEVGQTLIAKVGKVFGGEVVFRLKSIPGGAKVVVNDKQRGLTPEDGDTPLEITLELAKEQKVVVSRGGFNPWERTLNPQRREPVELTAVLRKEGTATDRRYENALKLYKRNADAGVAFLELLIEEDAPAAPKALLFLCREHHLKRNQVSSAIAKADKLRKKYGALDESAQADKALFHHAVSKFEKDTPFNRSIDGQQALIMALESFVKSQPENRHVEDARSRIQKARGAIHTHYAAASARLLKRFEGDLEDGLFTAAEARLKAYQQILNDADQAGAGLKVEEDKKVETLRVRMAKRKAYLAEMTAWRKAVGQSQNAADPDRAIQPWQSFLQSWPRGAMAARAQQALKEAEQAAKRWHKAEYEKAIGKAKAALDKADFSAAEAAVSQALRHRPNDASARTIQNQLVPIAVVASTPAGATVSITPTPPSAQTLTGLPTTPARITLRKNQSYTITISKKGYATETRTLRTTRGGEYTISVRLEESKLPDQLSQNFEIPSKSKDAHGNTVRLGFDKVSGLPQEIRHKATGIHLVLCPAGSFMMGSPANEKDRSSNETQHKVTLSQPFYIGKYEVTQAEWKKVMGKEPWKGEPWKGDERWKPDNFTKENPRHAATHVSWQDCQEFLKKLSGLGAPRQDKSGHGVPALQTTTFALPTEAQWEYACRSGTATRFYYGEDDNSIFLGVYAWFHGNALVAGEKYAHPVGLKKPNDWGLYDMHGNVWEWCSDWYGDYSSKAVVDPAGPATGGRRVSRGGSWFTNARGCRSAFRGRGRPSQRLNSLGFRVVLQGRR